MKIDVASVRKSLKAFDFKTLFREQLGWDNHQAKLDIPIDDHMVCLTAVAQKRGFVAFVCPTIPDRATRLKIDHQVTKSAREHFIIYSDEPAGCQVWQWVRREPGKPLTSRDHRFDAKQSGDPLIQRLDQIAVALDEEEKITVVDVTGRARAAFDVEKITKQFYDRFKDEHAAFMKFIKGIKTDAELQWYTSLMLNRLMFVYFIQKKGFLDGDMGYLRSRMAMVQKAQGKDKFQSFYRYFLLRLFHEGLGKSPGERQPELDKLLGKVPYLNGGFFEVHQLEERNTDIDIPDKAFQALFDFFDQYSWHLDERPLRTDNEINPDVVGYIFEKYINQKQMGAYYTKEDITEYISKNTIIPFLFDAAEKKCAVAFKPDIAPWRLLRDDPDRYIYAAVKHGVLDAKGNLIPLPHEIEAGLNDVAKRDGWSKPAPDPYGLPTETWREHVARRARCLELRQKLSAGDVHTINDLVTLNLDIWQFARDAIVNCEGPELLRAFWHAIEKLTVLDPTCGSGAFLFAALRILETLYSDCLERMERFVEDPAAKLHDPVQFTDFKKVLDQIARHPNDRYFILKSIIINNLFGVDIMEEAVEICKLRLFLKLVAQVEKVSQIEPLPDIDFNIRAGNTLVGYVTLDQVRASQKGTLGFGEAIIGRIEQDAEMVERAFQQFRAQQTAHGGKVTPKDKQELRRRLEKLDLELDRYLAGEYGVNANTKSDSFALWRNSHQPFHWFVEFYGIMRGGGFDVVIGNPPYVSTRGIDYLPASMEALRLPDIYGHVLLRSGELVTVGRGRIGMIVPLSLTFSEEFGFVRTSICCDRTAWFSSYDNIPAALFAGVSQRCTIWLGGPSPLPKVFVTQMCRWRSVTRASLLPTLCYTEVSAPDCATFGLPKLSSPSLTSLLDRITHPSSAPRRSTAALRRHEGSPLGFSQSARNFVSAFIEEPPCLDEKALKRGVSAKIGYVTMRDDTSAAGALAALLGELYFWYWLTRGDGFDVTGWIIRDFLQCLDYVPDEHMALLAKLGVAIHERRLEALVFKKNAGKFVGNYNFRGHTFLTRRADLVLLSGLRADRNTALEVFGHVQRVLAINEYAGEKSIPDAVKAKFRPTPPNVASEARVIAEADAVIRKHFGFSDRELDYLLHRDVSYGNGSDSAD